MLSFLFLELQDVVHGVQCRLRLTARATPLVCPSEVLPIVDGEVQMVQRMVGGSVDNVFKRVAGDHVRVMDEDGPDVDENKHSEVEVTLHGEEEDESVVG